jgi:CRP-like cAMP-binding protein
VNTQFYFENEFVTNIKSLTNGTRSGYSIVACEKLTVVKLEKLKLMEAYDKSPEIATFGRKVLELIISKQEEHADSFKLLAPKQRYEWLLSNRPDLLQRVTLTQLAPFLGISRETLSRLRRRR